MNYTCMVDGSGAFIIINIIIIIILLLLLLLLAYYNKSIRSPGTGSDRMKACGARSANQFAHRL